MKIAIIGNGAWGKAIYSLLIRKTNNVSILKRNQSASNFDIIIIAVPTQSIRDVLSNNELFQNAKIVINTSKGIERKTHLLPNEIYQQFPGIKAEYLSLIGPTFAKEVIKQMPSLAIIACKTETKNLNYVKNLLQTPYFRVKNTNHLEILELTAAFKNIYAIACGIADGLGYRANTRIKIIVSALEEMNLLFSKLNIVTDTNSYAGTLGDLVLTCSSTESRNFLFGKKITKYSVDKSLDKIVNTVEGYYSAFSVEYFEKKAKLSLPVASFVSQSINDDDPKKIKHKFNNLMINI